MSATPYVRYGTAESFGKAADRLTRERKDLLADAGYLQSEGDQTGRVLADTPGGRTVVYNNGDWHQTGRWDMGGYKKIAKTRCKKCAKSSKKCRYSTAKCSRRRRRHNRNSR
jgi:hypothetical protein